MSRASTVFVSPFALPSTLKFLRAAALLPDTTFSVVTQEPAARFLASLEAEVRGRIAELVVVEDCHDAGELERAVRSIAASTGKPVTALIGILEPLQEALALVRERLQIRGMDHAESVRFRDKSVMKDALRAQGLPCAQHHLATDAESAMDFARSTMPLVVKPPAGAGARDTFRVDDLDQLRGWLAQHPPTAERPLLLEEFVQGREFSFDSVSVGGQHLFHSVSDYSPTPLQVMETPWIQWTVLLPREIEVPEYQPILAAGPRALDALGMVTGMTHMEWFRRPDGSIAISEVAARPPGAQFTSLISYAHDCDFYRVWAEVSVLEEFSPPPRRFAAGAAYLRAQGTGRIATVSGLEEANRELGDLVVQSLIPAPGQMKSSSYEGDGYLILRHPETEVVRRGLERAVEILQVEAL
ncbi:MAG: ATP-grasp domain-containing protein [Planctomycetota bacterium]|nr:ATP-grasp domain-containing protein [Planctomycetota bacterium]